MSVFSANIVTVTMGSPPPPSDSGTQGIARGAAKPKEIHSLSFLTGGGLQDAVDQAILHGNGTAVVPELNEDVTGNANLKVTRDRLEWVKGMTTSLVKGGLLGTYGNGIKPEARPFAEFVFSSVYEGYVQSFQYAVQHEATLGTSDSIEFGNRTVTRLSYEIRNVYGKQANYTYGDVRSAFTGLAKEETVIPGPRHDRFTDVFTVEAIAGINLLWGVGLHLQCRPGAELNINAANVVIAVSESLMGLVNLEPVLFRLSPKLVKHGLSGARLAMDGGNIRFIGIPVGPMRIPTPGP